jgi:hypothetical protein
MPTAGFFLCIYKGVLTYRPQDASSPGPGPFPPGISSCGRGSSSSPPWASCWGPCLGGTARSRTRDPAIPDHRHLPAAAIHALPPHGPHRPERGHPVGRAVRPHLPVHPLAPPVGLRPVHGRAAVRCRRPAPRPIMPRGPSSGFARDSTPALRGRMRATRPEPPWDEASPALFGNKASFFSQEMSPSIRAAKGENRGRARRRRPPGGQSGPRARPRAPHVASSRPRARSARPARAPPPLPPGALRNDPDCDPGPGGLRQIEAPWEQEECEWRGNDQGAIRVSPICKLDGPCYKARVLLWGGVSRGWQGAGRRR